jgi:AcrR family transcriptional regulator
MARPTLQPEEVDRFRERLCGLALQRFADEGYAGVTLRALARDLGCSYATPYRYFRDKAHIFAAVRALAYERFGAALALGAEGISDPEQRMRSLGSAFLAFAKEEPHAYRMMFELSQPGTDTHPEYWAKERDTWAIWEAEVQHAVDAGYLEGDPSLIAHLFWAGLHGAVALHLAGKLILGHSVDELATRTMDALLAVYESTNTPQRGQRRKS